MSNQNTQHRSVEVLSTVYKRHQSLITNVQGEDGSGSYNKYRRSSGHKDNSPCFTKNYRKSQWEFLEKRCWTAFWLGRPEQYPAISRYACDMHKTLKSDTKKYMSYHTDLYR